MIKTEGLQHVGIIIPDLNAAAEWYVSTQGYEVISEREADGSRIKFLKNASGIMLELIERPDGSGEKEKAKIDGGWIDHLAFAVKDTQEAYDEAERLGMDIIEGPVLVPNFWDNGLSYVLVRSPGGEKIEFCKVL